MDKKNLVFAAYCVSSALQDVTRLQAERLTHLNIAFGLVENNLINSDSFYENRYYIEQIRSYNPNLQILISTGGGGKMGHGDATKPENLEAFVKSTMDIVRDLELDGIDCDWEFPCNTGHMEEKEQHVQLMYAYRRELDKYEKERGKKCWLTIAAAAWDKYLKNTDVKKVAEVLDFINLMTYGMRDAAWAENYTGYHTNLYSSEKCFYPDSVDFCVEKYHNIGIPYDKIVIGSAFYSRRWNNVPNINHGLNQKVTSPCIFGPCYSAIYHIYENGGEYVKYWDDDAKAPWLFNGDSFITYDDPMSMKYKAEYVLKKGVRGIMYWEHSYDKTGILFNAIYDNLFKD